MQEQNNKEGKLFVLQRNTRTTDGNTRILSSPLINVSHQAGELFLCIEHRWHLAKMFSIATGTISKWQIRNLLERFREV